MGDEARFILAVGGEDRGEVKAAVATFRRVWIDSTRGPWSGRAAEHLAALGHPVPDLESAQGRADVVSRLRALHDDNQDVEAVPLLEALEAVAPEALPVWERGRIWFRARKYPEAVARYREALSEGSGLTGSAPQLFELALATSRTGDYDGAAEIYRLVVARFPAHRKADEASFKLAYLPYDRRQCTEADAAFDAHLARYPQSDWAESSRWFQGWCRRLEGDREGSRAAWEDLARRAPRSELVPAAQWWASVDAEDDGDPERAESLRRALLKAHPTSGHAWLAAQSLGVVMPDRPDAAPPAWPDAWAQRAEVIDATALAAAGLVREARAVLDPVLEALGSDRQARLAAAWTLVSLGDARAGRRLVSRWCRPAQDTEADPAIQQVCFPRPQRTQVERDARAWGLPPLLPFAHMWSESLWNPSVTSYAGARGLMQIMPAELERLHAEAFPGATGPVDPDDLYLAAYNARIGVTELGTKARSLCGVLTPDSLPAVIAAYNGGEGAVRRWIEGEEPVRTGVFLERIGYSQTRRYARRVLGHLMAYRWVYGDRGAAAGLDTCGPASPDAGEPRAEGER